MMAFSTARCAAELGSPPVLSLAERLSHCSGLAPQGQADPAGYTGRQEAQARLAADRVLEALLDERCTETLRLCLRDADRRAAAFYPVDLQNVARGLPIDTPVQAQSATGDRESPIFARIGTELM